MKTTATPERTGHIWRFGVYEVDTRRGELRRNGIPLKLREQSLLVLTTLLEHAGDVVTREELRQVLWPSDVFVDFDHSLSMAILKLREALNDSVNNPRYIETVPKRGYCFIAPATRLDEGGDQPGSPVALPEAGPASTPVARRARWRSLPGSMILLLACCALGIVVGILFALDTWGIRDSAMRLLKPHNARLPITIESIAVLPLENLSGDREQEYFSDGLTDTLITYLGQITPWRVISRASVMRYKRGKTPLPQIARELNVDAVVEGTVQREAGRIQISVQLLDARGDRHLWANTYEHATEDILGFERRVALSIAHEISGRVLPAQETRLNGRRTVNPEAYDDYLHGRYLLGQRTAEAESGARSYFDEARRLDPEFALAYSGLADTYSVGWFVNMDLALAEQYGRRAVELDPGLAEGHASIGMAEVYEHNFAEAGKELRRAIELNPNYAMAHHWYSAYLLLTGRLSDALAANDRARQLDPFSLPINYLRGVMLVSLHDDDRAVEQLKFAASIDPGSVAPHIALQSIYWTEGRVAEALSEERIAATLSHHSEELPDIEKIAAANKTAGLSATILKDAELRQSWYARQQHSDKTPPADLSSSEEIALCYARLHDRQKTLIWLNRSFHDDPVDYPLNLSLPALQWLHSDAAFQALLRRAGLPA
jgi:TolB-like protein/DNA-binding winged helix-turn-helix (wHTH) protein/Tfp pilus assembly protein PilF